MKKILVATDFSTRSDRAVRRAILLARKFEAAVSLIHVVDDDRPKRIVDTERESASMLLNEQARSLRELDGVDCSASVTLGSVSEEITKAVEASMADVLVIGPHRHQAFQDVFVGTTAERTIRTRRHPVLVASGVPASFYRHVLVAVDLSDCSKNALRVVSGLGLDNHAAVSAVHVFDAPARSYMALGSASDHEVEDYLAREKARAAGELAVFMRGLEFTPARHVLKPNEPSTAHVVCATAREVSADLIVVGTRGRTGITKFLLGSVAEEILHIADRDVLAVPPERLS
jgi:nucleotide-binding universal stress UspA family protein